MWPFKKKEKLPILPYKTGEGFFQYWCKYGSNPIAQDEPLLALVLDASKLLGTREAVKQREDGVQILFLRVASDDGGFEVLAETSGSGASLTPGDVVMWVPGKYMPELAERFPDSRGGWIGIVVAKVAPEIDMNTKKFRVTSWYRTSE